MRDMRDALGALGPVDGQNPELNNLTCSMTYVQEGDLVFLTSDGISDNFDPVVGKFVLPKKESKEAGVGGDTQTQDTSAPATEDTQATAALQQTNGKRKSKQSQRQQQLLQKYQQIHEQQQQQQQKKQTRGQKIRNQQVASMRNGFKQVRNSL